MIVALSWKEESFQELRFKGGGGGVASACGVMGQKFIYHVVISVVLHFYLDFEVHHFVQHGL